jgi:C-terminal processing protease CtpA/Prc
VAVMTSASTYSAAETFAMSMRQRANTVLIGEATAGGFSDGLNKSLPHGTIFSLSNEFYLTPDNEEFEGVGVPVDIEQAFFTLEQREQGIDLGLEKAEAWIIQQ